MFGYPTDPTGVSVKVERSRRAEAEEALDFDEEGKAYHLAAKYNAEEEVADLAEDDPMATFLREHPDVLARLRERYRHVMVDEYQDTNKLQAGILYALKPDGRGLTVVGDDAQAIYSFRGADVLSYLQAARNAGKRHTRLLPDGWTVVTKDHSLSAQWEHTILVTDTGHEVLTCLPGDDL